MRAAAILTVIFPFALLFTTAAAQDRATVRIEAIHVQLFYERTGALSQDIPPDWALWNTIIGAGDVGQPSQSTLVTVEVSGPDVRYGAIRALVTAQEEGERVIARREAIVSLYDESGRFFVPLWLDGTGCDVITINAQLVGDGADTQVATRVVRFRCGE